MGKLELLQQDEFALNRAPTVKQNCQKIKQHKIEKSKKNCWEIQKSLLRNQKKSPTLLHQDKFAVLKSCSSCRRRKSNAFCFLYFAFSRWFVVYFLMIFWWLGKCKWHKTGCYGYVNIAASFMPLNYVHPARLRCYISYLIAAHCKDVKKSKKRQFVCHLSSIAWSCIRKYIDTSAPPCPHMIGSCYNQKQKLFWQNKKNWDDKDLL